MLVDNGRGCNNSATSSPRFFSWPSCQRAVAVAAAAADFPAAAAAAAVIAAATVIAAPPWCNSQSYLLPISCSIHMNFSWMCLEQVFGSEARI
jgi:hypothetical protein